MTVRGCQQHFRAQRRTDAGRAEQNLRLTITDVIDDIKLYIITVQIFLNRMVDFSGLETLRKRNVGKPFQINPIRISCSVNSRLKSLAEITRMISSVVRVWIL